MFGQTSPFLSTDPIIALNFAGGRSWMWFNRHGVSMHRLNESFWNFLIDGVGEAPVLAFLVLITLFALVIGPINYLALRKTGRQFLMMITVPLGAGVVTTMLVCYAMVSDGLGVKVRTRSVIHLDQRTGQSTTWSRQNYYASLAPSRGLSYPEDAAAYSIRYTPKPEGVSPYQRTEWSNGEQKLRSGFMSSRDWCQLLVIRDRKTSAGLVISKGTDGSPKVVNQLGTVVKSLALIDTDGLIYISDTPTNPDDQIPLQAASLAETKEFLVKISGDNMTGLNRAALRRANRMNSSSRNRRRWFRISIDRGAQDARSSTSLMERAIVDSLEQFTPKRRTYYAIVEDSTEVPMGTPSKRYESLELVIGRW